MQTTSLNKILTERRMNEIIMTYKFSFIFTFAGVFVLIVSNSMHFDIFKYLIASLTKINQWAVDEILFLFLLITTGFFIDQFIHKKNIMLENKSYAIFKATMESLNDIMCNYIQFVQLYRSDMEGKSDPQREKELDELTELMLNKLRNLELAENINDDVLYSNIRVLRNSFTRH